MAALFVLVPAQSVASQASLVGTTLTVTEDDGLTDVAESNDITISFAPLLTYTVTDAGNIVTPGPGCLDEDLTPDDSVTCAGAVQLISVSTDANADQVELDGSIPDTNTSAINGGPGGDTLVSGEPSETVGPADTMTGEAGVDSLSSFGGDDTLDGGAGRDTLSGGSGKDIFRLDSPLSAATNVDDILDFNPAADTIVLDRTVFTRLAVGSLAPEAFRAGTAAADADDRILYDAASGNIYFDSDGSAAVAVAILFARVDAGTALTDADFMVVI